ncbi:MAG: hypothetical protein OEY49_19675 [Candidatus Heimdallarchaeota archaeon]|nr:hypothetical protein [Candidatus Heimdallarchaeota archaeon]
MKLNILRLILLLFILIGIASVPSIYGTDHSDYPLNLNDEDDDDEEDDEDPEDEEEAYEREVHLEVNSDSVKIESELKNGDTKDKFEMEFKVEDEPKIKFEFKTESDSTEVELKYRIEFDKIIEFDDADNNGFAMDESVFSTYEFESVGWNDIVHTTTSTTTESGDTAQIDIFTATTSDGVFSIIMKVSGSLVDYEGSTLTPNSIKFDVAINDYPYAGEGSSLAIKTEIKTESETSNDEDTHEEESGMSAGEEQVTVGQLGYFSWAETATADGQTVDVVDSALQSVSPGHEDEDDDLDEGETETEMYFTFIVKDAVDILWDPKVGVISEASLAYLDSLSGFLPYNMWISLLALLVAVPVFNKKRK